MPVNQQETKDKIGLGLSGPAPLELGRSGVRDMVISAPRHPAAKHKRRRGPEDQKGPRGHRRGVGRASGLWACSVLCGGGGGSSSSGRTIRDGRQVGSQSVSRSVSQSRSPGSPGSPGSVGLGLGWATRSRPLPRVAPSVFVCLSTRPAPAGLSNQEGMLRRRGAREGNDQGPDCHGPSWDRSTPCSLTLHG